MERLNLPHISEGKRSRIESDEITRLESWLDELKYKASPAIARVRRGMEERLAELKSHG